MPNRLTETFNSITIRKGEAFTLELKSNPSTGYSWNVEITSGTASLLRHDFVAAGNALGAGGTERFSYTAASDVTLRATYARFDKQVAREYDFSVKTA